MTAKLKAPEGVSACSFDGEEFAVDVDTCTVDVPDEAVAALVEHGFTSAPDQGDEADRKHAAPKTKKAPKGE